MNDIAKQAISERLRKACKDEGLTREKASELLGMNSIHYVGFIVSGKPSQWKNVSKAAWECAQAWTNSGETIQKYSQKHSLNITSDILTLKETLRKSVGYRIPDKPTKIPPPEIETKQYPASRGREIDFEGIKVPFEINIIIKINGKEVLL